MLKLLLISLITAILANDPVFAGSDEEIVAKNPTLHSLEKLAMGPSAVMVLSDLCMEYLNREISLENGTCKYAAYEMLKYIDARDILYPSEFMSQLISILNSDEGDRYLSSLFDAVNLTIAQGKEFNLWRWTLLYMGGRRSKTLEWMAVLFQDWNAPRLLGELKIKTGVTPKYADQFQRTLQTLMYNNRPPNVIRFLPIKEISQVTDVYHFYVPAYLADRLARTPGIDSRMAVFMPILLNTRYEYNYLYTSQKKSIDRFVEGMTGPDPEKISEHDQHHLLEASYLGYAGAIWANETLRDVLPKQIFFDRFAADPYSFLSGLIH